MSMTWPKMNILNPINVKIAELREALESVTAEQKYLKARDARHRRTNESTRKRVVFYTIGEYTCWPLQVLYKSYMYGSFSANRWHTTEFEWSDQF